ncbi:type II secretion system F family protein [Chitinimonas sp. BJYL2]|uniref:type II secretion system F family protein n=1 Tax=Chitinimonas sp. BJYL2 TaxID=2976696 RepID=UPI0022B3DD3B|nr:type II secretion system F family protein [Chitinimonas sp. BJYL2]
MQFKYRAIDNQGRTVRGQLEASNTADLETRLARLELTLISEKAVASGKGLFAQKAITRKDLITFCFHMEQMTRAGVPLLDGLADLRDTIEHPAFREILAVIIEDIEGGLQLSQALGNHPNVFAPVFVNLIQAGEETGKLADVLLSLVDTLKWQDELAAQTKKVLMYPAFVGSVVLGVVVFLLAWLVPQLVKFIQSMQQELPWNTRLLIALSDFIVNDWWVILTLIGVGIGGWLLWRKSDPEYQYKVDGLKLRVPFIGPVLQKIMLARFAAYFALTYSSGIAILESIRILEGVVGNVVIARGLVEVRGLITEGQGVAASFEKVRLFPPLVIRMLRVGENTGGLDSALRNVSYFYNREVKESIERVQSLIEPVMTVVLGFILGSVMLSVLGPIYDLLTKIKI